MSRLSKQLWSLTSRRSRIRPTQIAVRKPYCPTEFDAKSEDFPVFHIPHFVEVTMAPRFPFVVVVLLLLLIPAQGGGIRRPKRYTEEERQAEYKRRGYTFPIEEFNPNTEGWHALMSQRVTQLMANPVSQEKWDGWIQTMASALTVPNHTEFGWGLTHAPEELTQVMQQAIYEGLPNARSEGHIDVIDGPNIPLFIDRPDLTKRVSLHWVSL